MENRTFNEIAAGMEPADVQVARHRRFRDLLALATRKSRHEAG
jgi:hypothetical protein